MAPSGSAGAGGCGLAVLRRRVRRVPAVDAGSDLQVTRERHVPRAATVAGEDVIVGGLPVAAGARRHRLALRPLIRRWLSAVRPPLRLVKRDHGLGGVRAPIGGGHPLLVWERQRKPLKPQGSVRNRQRRRRGHQFSLRRRSRLHVSRVAMSDHGAAIVRNGQTVAVQRLARTMADRNGRHVRRVRLDMQAGVTVSPAQSRRERRRQVNIRVRVRRVSARHGHAPRAVATLVASVLPTTFRRS